MSSPISPNDLDPIDQVHSHDAIFTRGFEYGYVYCAIEYHIDIDIDVLVRNKPVFTDALTRAGADIVWGEPHKLPNCAEFISLSVRW